MLILKPGIKWGSKYPKKLFLIDGLGAILSAFLLGVVLVEFERFFGIPRLTLYFLALLPVLFALYDFYCYLSKIKRIAAFLRGIALMNTAYSILSITLAIYHFQKITYLGWSYILLEILIVITLATIEWKVAFGLTHERKLTIIEK